MLIKRRYISDIEVFDMFKVILPNTFNFFKTLTPLVETINLDFMC